MQPSTDEVQLPRGQGQTVEFLCAAMAVLSVAGGVLCAMAFGEASYMTYGGRMATQASMPVVIGWLGAGVGSAVAWWALGRIGTILRYVEAIAQHNGAVPMATPVESGAEPEAGLVKSEIEGTEQALPETEEPVVPLTPEQEAARARAARVSQLIMIALFVGLGVVFYLAISGR